MKTFTPEEIATIVDHALIALLWSEGEIYGEDGEPTLENWDETYDYNDATAELRETIRAEVSSIDGAEIDDTVGCAYRLAAHEYVAQMSLESFGHDISLTRNHHGAGFWDRGLGELGDTLSQWAENLGTLHVFHGSESTTPVEWAGMFHAE